MNLLEVLSRIERSYRRLGPSSIGISINPLALSMQPSIVSMMLMRSALFVGRFVVESVALLKVCNIGRDSTVKQREKKK